MQCLQRGGRIINVCLYVDRMMYLANLSTSISQWPLNSWKCLTTKNTSMSIFSIIILW